MRSQVLDSLRALAIILVLFRHHSVSSIMNQIGWIGVDLFFVLSGFLVSGLLFKEYKKTEKIKPLRFLARRGLKIYPLFYFFLIVTVAGYYTVRMMGFESHLDLSRMVYEVFFIQNYFRGVWNHTWSLAIEEHFYILLALIVYALARSNNLQKQKLVLTGIIATILVIIVARIVTWHVSPNHSLRANLFPTHLRMDSLLFGVLISYIFHFQSSFFYAINKGYGKFALLTAIGLLSSPFLWEIDSTMMGTIGLTMLYLGFGLILWLVIANESYILQIKLLRPMLKTLSFVGFYSYSIYLFHLMVASFAMPLLNRISPVKMDGKVQFMLYALMCLAVGVVASKIIEQPFLRLREKYFI